MSIYDDFVDAVKGGLGDLIDNTVGDFADSAKQRTEDFLAESRADLEKWVKQVADGDLAPDDFEFLVKGLGDLGKINALTEVGAAKIAVDRFRNGLIQLLVDSALGLVPS